HLHVAFREGLAEMGFIDGKNVAIESRCRDALLPSSPWFPTMRPFPRRLIRMRSAWGRPHLPCDPRGRQHQLGQYCVSDAPLLRTRPMIVTGVHGHDEVERGHQEQALAAPTGAGDQALSTDRSANGDVA